MRTTEFKDTELGPIPKEWEVRRLGEIGKFSKGTGISRAESSTGELPAIRYGEIYTHHNDYVKHYISRISKDVSKRASLTNRGDILFAGSGETEEDIGKSVAVLDDGVYAGGDLIIFSFGEPADPIFWGYLLNLSYVQRQKTLLAQGGTVVHIRATSIASIKVAFPPLSEQRRIAAVLGDVDKLIENLKKRIAKKKNIKRGAMQELLTGKRRLKGFTGKWVERRLGEIGDVVVGQSPESYYYNSTRNGLPLIQGNADIKNRWSFIRIYTSQITKVCEKGDVILSVRAPVGAVGRASYKSCLGRGVCAIRSENDFLYQYFLFVENDWGQYSTGSTFDSINSKQLSNFKLLLPPLSEQRAIAAVLSDMDAEIANLEEKLKKLMFLKQGMMQDLLTGKVRLV